MESVPREKRYVRRRRLRRAFVVFATVGTSYLIVSGVLDAYGRGALGDDVPAVESPPDRTFDAIVVAGCGVRDDGRPSDALARRVERGVQLFRAGVAPRMVFTGGVGVGAPRSESSAAAEYAQSLGVPLAAIAIEEESTSTRENAKYAAEILGHDTEILVVSDAYHVFRCERVFRHEFAAVQGAGAISPAWPRVRGAVREVAVLAVYYAAGFLE